MRKPTGLQAVIAGATVMVVAAGITIAAVVARTPPETEAAPSASPSSSPSETPEADPGFPPNTETYDIRQLPAVDVFTLARDLPVDDAPDSPVLPLLATPMGAGAPLFADPLAAPVGHLPSSFEFNGTTVPVIERQEDWVRVMISGRAGLPSEGITGQLTAWMRAADVSVVDNTVSVRVSLATPSISILDGDEVVYESAAFAIGAPATPTPTGRSFIMTTQTDPAAGYTRGHPLVYLGVQSPSLDGFAGQNNAITAFHYHDDRSGDISNGCLRVDADTIDRLAALPLGTPVVIVP